MSEAAETLSLDIARELEAQHGVKLPPAALVLISEKITERLPKLTWLPRYDFVAIGEVTDRIVDNLRKRRTNG